MSNIDKPAKRRIAISQDGEQIKAEVPDAQMLRDLFGTGDTRLASAMLHHLIFAAGTTDTGQAEADRDFLLSVVEDFAPRDAVERLLITQMAATHVALMRAAKLQADAKYAESLDVYSNSYNRLARTFTAQAEQLRRHRTGGQSKVIVEHVTVNEGGQAIVGNVEN